jgi:RecA-family ATPase
LDGAVVTDFIQRLAADPDAVLYDHPPQPADDIPLLPVEAEPADEEPPLDWRPFGVVEPQKFGADSVAIDLLDFLAQGDEGDEEEWFVRGLIPKNSFTVLGGHPKSGKTLLVIDLGMAAVTGREFFGRETAQATFLYVTEEGSPVEMRKRFRRLIASGGVPDPGAVRLIYRRGTRFDDPRSWDAVRHEIQTIDGPVLLVLDPLRDLLIGDENDSNILNRVGHAIREVLRDFPDVTVVLLHHLAKRSEGSGGVQLRGSTALWGSVDCTLLLKTDALPDDSEEGGEVPLKGKLEMQSRIAASARFFWRWDDESGQFIETSSEARNLADKAAALLAESGQMLAADLADALATTPDVIRHTLRRDKRFTYQTGGPGKPNWWELAE